MSSNINFSFMSNRIRYIGSTKTNSKKEAKDITDGLKARIKILEKLSSTDAKQAYSIFKKDNNDNGPSKTPIYSVEKKFFSALSFESLTFDRGIEIFLTYYKREGSQKSQGVQAYETHLSVLEDYAFFQKSQRGRDFFADVDKEDFDKYFDIIIENSRFSTIHSTTKKREAKKVRTIARLTGKKKTYQTSSIKKKRDKIIRCLEYLSKNVDSGIIVHGRLIKDKNTNRQKEDRVRAFDDDEIDVIKAHIDNDRYLSNKICFNIALNTGLRLADCILLKPDYLLKRGDQYFLELRTQKTNTFVKIPVSPELKDFLDAYGNYECEYFFPHEAGTYRIGDDKGIKEKGGKVSSTYSKRFNTLLIQLGLDVLKNKFGHKSEYKTLGEHSLRHTFIRNMRRKRVSAHIVQGVVGHNSAEMTEYYGDGLTDEDYEEMLNAMHSL